MIAAQLYLALLSVMALAGKLSIMWYMLMLHVHDFGQVELLLTLEEYCEEERDHTAHGHCFEAVFQQVRCCNYKGMSCLHRI